jgi:8-oxo-dGTP pyrophosphatase MutT (NUDIX family)
MPAIITKRSSFFLATRTHAPLTLVGTDGDSGLLTAPGGQIEESDATPYHAAERECREECGPRLRFILVNAVPLVVCTRPNGGEVVPHPRDKEKVELKFYFRVVELSDFQPEQMGKEMLKPDFLDLNPRQHKLRLSFKYALQKYQGRAMWPRCPVTRAAFSHELTAEALLAKNIAASDIEAILRQRIAA